VDAKAAAVIDKRPQTAARFLQSIFLQSIAFLIALTRADKKWNGGMIRHGGSK
jgi:hypothetical protein